MAQILIAYMNGEEIEFDALIRAIEIPLSVQRMLGRMQELLDNNIHVNEYQNNMLRQGKDTVYTLFPYAFTSIEQ